MLSSHNHVYTTNTKAISRLVSGRENREPFAPIDHTERLELEISDDWAAQCRARLRAMGQGQAGLANYLGASQSAVSRTIGKSGEWRRSELVEPISVALGVEMPLLAQAELIARQLSETQPELLRAHLKALLLSLDKKK